LNVSNSAKQYREREFALDLMVVKVDFLKVTWRNKL